jgi:hypothetical protein
MVCIATGFAVTLYFFTPTNVGQQIQTQAEIQISPTPFSLQPPAQALTGILSTATGDVKHKLRDTGAFTTATPSASIKLGESIATGVDGHAVITIETIGTITMEPESEIVFSNVFKENTVLVQKAGKIQYVITSTYPVAIRAINTLTSFKDATILMNIIDSDIAITAARGEGKVGIVDAENTTHVYPIQEGKRANIDTVTRSVVFVSPR